MILTYARILRSSEPHDDLFVENEHVEFAFRRTLADPIIKSHFCLQRKLRDHIHCSDANEELPPANPNSVEFRPALSSSHIFLTGNLGVAFTILMRTKNLRPDQ